jgi:AcrR family transcriptional regulator
MEPNKREKLTEFNRVNILNAARVLFEENGIRQTTVDDIAAKAGCSKSTVYVYFTSKVEIYQHLLFKHMVLLRDRFKTALRKKTGFDESFFAVCRVLTDFHREFRLISAALWRDQHG